MSLKKSLVQNLYIYILGCVLIVKRYFVNVVHMIWHGTHLSKEFDKNDYDKLKLMTHFYQNLPENVNYFLEVGLRISTFVNNSSSVH